MSRTKRCCKCRKYRSKTSFARDKGRKDGLHPECKVCQRPRWAKYYASDRTGNLAKALARQRVNKDRYWISKIQRKFGLTQDQYQSLFVAQGGLCAICGKPETQTWKGRVRVLAVDHDHTTGQVRGLLCARCNAGLGQFKDNLELLAAAIRYLEVTQTRKTA